MALLLVSLIFWLIILEMLLAAIILWSVEGKPVSLRRKIGFTVASIISVVLIFGSTQLPFVDKLS